MATVDYAKYITTLLNNLSLVVWTVANDIADLRSNNQVVIEVLHMLLVIILILYLLRCCLRNYQYNQSILKQILENQEVILAEIVDMKEMSITLDSKLCKVINIIDPPFNFQGTSTDNILKRKRRRRRSNEPWAWNSPPRAAKLRAQYKILYGKEMKNE